jgi:allantoinase
MKDLDQLIHGGTVVTDQSIGPAEIGVVDGKIAVINPHIDAAARDRIDAAGLHVFPGLIDAHVHFNEPGRAHWEGIETGSRALAAGGGTLFFDMPLNAHPPTLDAESFDLKKVAAEAKSVVDFAFWGGLVPHNLDRLEELGERGVVGFKAFMAESGIDDFPRVEEQHLREGMRRAAALGLPVAVHAESDALTKRLAQECLAEGRSSVRDYLESRPIAAELEAIERAIMLASETGCALHVVHVSSGPGIELIVQAREKGLDVSCETCPHYLILTEGDMERIGAIAKCAPPLRPINERENLWRHVLAEQVTTIGSDHSPSPPEMKAGADFFKVWGGISGVQHTRPLLLTEGHVNRAMALQQIAKLTSVNVSRRFKLRSKGRLAVGTDADFALVDLAQSFQVRGEDLLYRHPHSPYVGRKLQGQTMRTFVRGREVFRDGKIIASRAGRLIRPNL